MASGSVENTKSLDRLLNETINETREKAPQSEDQGYNREQLRQIAEQFSRRYVSLIRSERDTDSI